MTMRYLSICSGVGTDRLAWDGLGWECAGFAEIEPFPFAILAHRYPEVRNYGDFTAIPADIGPVDLLVGGTPCQSFSVAGQRAGLDDPRGNLTLEFARLARRLRPRWIVWENVPGVLSSDQGRDFAAILTAFRECGYSVCYRVLDAQHYGVPQRRRRVFVVGHLGDDWRPSAAVLLESEGMSGHPATGQTAGEGVAWTLGGGAGSRGGHGTRLLTQCDLDRATFIPVDLPAISGNVTTTWGAKNATNHEEACSGALIHGYAPDQSPTLQADCGSRVRNADVPLLAGTWWNGDDTAPCLTRKHDHRMPDAGMFSAVLQPMLFDLAQITSKLNYSQARPKNMVPPLNTVSQMHVALDIMMSNNGGSVYVAEEVAYTLDQNQPQAVARSTVVRRLTPRECERLQGWPDDHTLVPYRGKPASDAPRYKAIGNGMAMPVLRWIGERIAAWERAR